MSEITLSKRFASDIGAGMGAAFATAPFITPMDAAVTESMSGRTTIGQSLKSSFKEILTRPHRYMMRPEYRVVYGTYAATYVAKNTIDSYCTHHNKSNEVTSFWKFWGVLAVNGSLCVFWRDPVFAKIFGTKAATKVPAISYVFWASRDVIHTTGAVVAPDYCERAFDLTKDQWRIAQVTFPLLVQSITTPVHLLGLDYYNIKDGTFGARMSRTATKWIPSMLVRMCRMFPPWSVGLVANREIKNYLMSM